MLFLYFRMVGFYVLVRVIISVIAHLVAKTSCQSPIQLLYVLWAHIIRFKEGIKHPKVTFYWE